MPIRTNRILGEMGAAHNEILFLVLASVHGNETAGIRALDLIFKMLEVEPIRNPSFELKGKIVGIIGNLSAHQVKKRYIDLDLNRQWTNANIELIRSEEYWTTTEEAPVEFEEMKAIDDMVFELIEKEQPRELVVLDIHTTSAKGGIFSICPDDEASIALGLTFHAPVLTGFLKGVRGTMMHYFSSKRMGLPTTVITFESGQHVEKLSVNRAIAAIINSLKHLGMVPSDVVEIQHDRRLRADSEGLPRLAELLIHHPIKVEDRFRMLPGFKNFDRIRAGQKLAEDRLGPIHSPTDGMILMPLYQKQGADGFFIIQPVEVPQGL